ncbi:ATP-binding cassette domain-containing protein [Flavobacterium sp. NKUCC04_CG]|uniref:ATP-binding cassette domain-containing protein n=1 Tax=Flavobacterium sp. NKUCC04_CG TaxID=2842121 RepID=UPI001C5BA643|nr:ATP-binding cassette domain-containing protein [Flavobacterium sp. NKUCC04_CG]MBW3518437.1 ATP-binding cassette domain-containing protein [Flavobacterium sp. NKUCC04_CG]
MLKIEILEKKYGTSVVLENITLTINKAGVYGLVGKNGQGKTTLFRSVLGLEKFNGTAELNQEKTSLQKIAWCPAEPLVYDELTAAEFYSFYRELLNLENTKIDYLFELPKDKLIREFSTGMKKKVFINAVFQKEYAAYFLDEPFNGLDIESNYILMKKILQLAENSIVIISSHIIDVLYQHCEKIFVVNDKQLLEFLPQDYNQIQNTLFLKK